VNIAVADEGGNIAVHVLMDNVWISSIDILMKKAYTSRAFDIENEGIGKAFSIGRRVLRHSCFQQQQNHDFCWRHPAETRWQGSRGDWRSGGSGDQDHAVAAAGAAAF
jgi:uncharacterized protein GlcG (DUF336 family)